MGQPGVKNQELGKKKPGVKENLLILLPKVIYLTTFRVIRDLTFDIREFRVLKHI